MLISKLASVAGLVGATVLAAAGPAAFAAPADQVTLRVSIADLNMTSEAGARVALTRIRHAAKEICGDTDGRVSLDRRMQLNACVERTVEQTVTSANSSTLMAVSQGRHVTLAAR